MRPESISGTDEKAIDLSSDTGASGGRLPPQRLGQPATATAAVRHRSGGPILDRSDVNDHRAGRSRAARGRNDRHELRHDHELHFAAGVVDIDDPESAGHSRGHAAGPVQQRSDVRIPVESAASETETAAARRHENRARDNRHHDHISRCAAAGDEHDTTDNRHRASATAVNGHATATDHYDGMMEDRRSRLSGQAGLPVLHYNPPPCRE
jgi:hypothetical protein